MSKEFDTLLEKGETPLLILDKKDSKFKFIRRDGYYPEVITKQFVNMDHLNPYNKDNYKGL